MGRVLLEASAGTGKTFNLTSLVVRYVVEESVPIDSFLIVTFTRSAAAELRKKTREKLLEALAAMEQGLKPNEVSGWLVPIVMVDSEEELKDRIELVRNAVTSLDGAMITTIHGFCQRTLSQIGVRNGGLALDNVGEGSSSRSAGIVRDVLLATLANDINYFGEDLAESPEKVDQQIREVVRALVANSALPHPPLDEHVGIAANWVSVVESITEMQEQERHTNGETSFDDLILVLQKILTSHELGDEVRKQLAAQYSVIMIDEFQDTDSKQWEIFNSIYESPSHENESSSNQLALIMVGDPKQAIYRFRGADINAYLYATDDDRNLRRFSLSTNHRSDKRLIAATNVLLNGREFGHERISYVQVTSPDRAPDGALTDGGAPLQIRWLPSHPELLDGSSSLTVDIARPRIAEDLAAHVIHLLNNARITTDKGERRVTASDITVLVRAKGDAKHVVEALQQHGVPVIQSRLDSVLDAEASEQLGLLLIALDGFADVRTVRALAFSWFVDLPYEDLLNEQKIEHLQERCARWADELRQRGIFSFYQRFRLDNDVVKALASNADRHGAESLERLQTDLEHLVELLHSQTERLQLDARGYLLELAMLKAQTGDSETQERRTESDLNAVNITTIHSSKGLEYPIVLVPYPKAVTSSKPFVYSIGKQRYVDVAPLVDWEAAGLTADSRKELARLEADGDEMRLAYVALTRAKYQTVVWWANTRRMGDSPLAKILFDQTGTARSGVKVPKDPEVRARFDEIQKKSPGSLSVFEIPPRPEVVELVNFVKPDAPSLSVASLTRDELTRSDYWRWSYSSVKSTFSDYKSEKVFGGRDEPWGSESWEPVVESLLQEQPSGPDYGSWVHAFMEEIDFAHPRLVEHIGEVFDGLPKFVGVDRSSHVLGLAAAIDTPLDQIQRGFSLRKLSRENRIDEADFLMALGAPEAPSRLADLARLLAADKSHPFHDYFARLAENPSPRSFQGFLTGSLDGLYRLTGDTEPRFLVVDYKTNKLRDYGSKSMQREMENHDYPLQALFYSVGLHRFLKMRMQNYDPERHLAGSAYLFLRGMVGADTAQVESGRAGVYAWTFRPAIVDAASRWFNGEKIG